MRMADYMELFLRMDSLTAKKFHAEINPQFKFSRDTTTVLADSAIQYSRRLLKSWMTTCR